MSVKRLILGLISDLKDNVFTECEEQSDLAMVEFFFDRLSTDVIMKRVVDKVLPYEKQIKDRDIDFFRKNDSIFGGLPGDRVEHYKKEILTLSKENQDILWSYFDVIVKHAKIYKKNI